MFNAKDRRPARVPLGGSVPSDARWLEGLRIFMWRLISNY